jgi:putative ABC transport system substrate-binding protein
VALDPPATRAARRATQTIPIVMRVSSDPVEDGLVSSLARPGGNLTGLYSLYELLASKRLELLHQAIPGLKQVAVLWDPANRSSLVGWSETERAARSLGVGLQSVEVAEGAPLEPAFRSAKGSHSGALLTLRNPRIVRERSEVLRLAARHRLPAIYDERALVEAGGLMSYGASLTDLHRRAASYVDKILRGAKPADLPVEQPTKFELVINLKTANALGLTIPPSLLVRADELTQ